MQRFKRSPSDFIGLAGFMRMIIAGTNLAGYGSQLLDYITRHPDDANALMDLSTILYVIGSRENAAARQMQALALRRLYHLPASVAPARLRLLALAGPGDLQVNMPLDFLLEGSDVALDVLYLRPGEPVQVDFTSYDVAIVIAGISDESRPLLRWIEASIRDWPLTVLNRPDRIALTERDRVAELLAAVPGLRMPQSRRVGREALAGLTENNIFPFIVRPVGSHGGRGLVKAQNAGEVEEYLKTMSDEAFFVAPYIDYRSPDGLFRKYRIVMIGDRFFACHMAIADEWMIHYVNAGMEKSQEKRSEEAHFMAAFNEGFALRHEEALAAIHARMGLDYLVIDCAETRKGELLVFEADTGGVVHAMDPVEYFPYKRPQMLKIFDAFRAMLKKAANKRMAPLSVPE